MARVSNPLIGKSANKVGNVVFSTWKGINVLKEKPASVANPRTDGQVSQRSVMTQLVRMARLILPALQVSFREMAVRMSQYNAFVKFNADEAFSRVGAVATFIPANLTASKGTLGPLVDFAKVGLTGRSLSLEWTDNTGTSGANASDEMHLVIVSADGQDIVHMATGDDRIAASTTMTIPGTWSLTGARCCGYFVKADGSQSCDSVNIAV